MEKYYKDTELIQRIQNIINTLDKTDEIWIHIWAISRNKIELIIMVTELPTKLNNQKTFSIASLNIENESPQILKDEGHRIKRLLTKTFKTIKIRSNLHYKL